MKNSDIRIYNQDCFDFLKTLPDCSIDCVIIDPPYGVLGDNEIETAFNKEHKNILFQELYRVLKKDGFCCFFGQEPTLTDWNISCRQQNFKYKEHIVWAKRGSSNPILKILRTHESFMIYAKGNPEYNITTGNYSDVKLSLLEVDCIDLETIKANLEMQRQVIKGLVDKTLNINSPELKKYTQNSKGYLQIKNQYNRVFRGFQSHYKGVNFTNLWSFSSGNKITFGKDGENQNHPTVKNIEFIQRAIELCSKDGDVILDCFLGSGTTAVACKALNRNFVGCEINKEYYDLSMKRLQEYKHQDNLF